MGSAEGLSPFAVEPEGVPQIQISSLPHSKGHQRDWSKEFFSALLGRWSHGQRSVLRSRPGVRVGIRPLLLGHSG